MTVNSLETTTAARSADRTEGHAVLHIGFGAPSGPPKAEWHQIDRMRDPVRATTLAALLQLIELVSR